MLALLGLISRYGLVGIVNTLIHWLIFFMLYNWLSFNQAISNGMAFLVAVSSSFFLNAHFTYKSHTNIVRYLLFTSFMGALSVFTGVLADKLQLSPWFTLLGFTALSFVIGFIWSNYFVFKR